MVARALLVCLLSLAPGLAAASQECVILLHGLLRVSNSMSELEAKLNKAGYVAVNINYPSRSSEIAVLADDAVGRGLAQCRAQHTPAIHFITHSLGGILMRYYEQHQGIPELGRVVMLGPPNHGSELVDGLAPVPGFHFLTGPTGAVLGTDDSSILKSLEPVHFDLGVIAGTTNINPLALLFLPSPNDSIVSVESTRVEGMHAHLVLPVTHTLMMRNNEVIDNAIHYLKTGDFIPR